VQEKEIYKLRPWARFTGESFMF